MRILCVAFHQSHRPSYQSIVPSDLQLFEEGDIPRYFEYLEKTFHLSTKWRDEYKLQLQQSQRSMPTLEVFFRFLKTDIEPALRTITQRKEVVFAIGRYLIKDRIEEKQREDRERKEYYKSGKWKQ